MRVDGGGVGVQSTTCSASSFSFTRPLGGPGELLLIATFGLLAGVLVGVQFPLLDVVSFISGKIYFYSIVASALAIYLVTILCGLYPSWLATKVQPAEALHYE